MVPKLHKKGSSFKGAAAYLLHDKGRAQTSERVSWTHAQNLALDDPEAAWRIMAATAMDQERLKHQAGIKSTGRKSSDSVLHLTLAWHPEEKGGLSQSEMMRAAQGAIHALGAGEYQALIIAHNDEAHPHLHILINRVHPLDGRMLPSSKEKLNLSRWAENYELERGKIYCDERVRNNEARSRGEYTRCAGVLDRRAYEQMQNWLWRANDNHDHARRIQIRQKADDAFLSQKGRDLVEKHRHSWDALEQKYERIERASQDEARSAAELMVKAVRDAYRPDLQQLRRRHQGEREAFNAREQKLAGRLGNVADSLRRDERDASLGDLFRLLSSRGEREKAFHARQIRERQTLQRAQRKKEKEVKTRIRETAHIRRARHAAEYLGEREHLIKIQNRERQALRRQWRQRSQQCAQEWHDFSNKHSLKDKAKSDFDHASGGYERSKEALKERIRQRLREGRSKDKGRDGR
ncbi:MAG: relaxase/mobilization nuclease domain-containing protein [Parvularculaceae bacterium]